MSHQNSLQKKIGLWAATSIVAGSIIGSGVFMKPATMAAQLGSPIWLTLVWIIAGIFSLFGALIYAELGAMMPRTGGIYVYFREMFGEFIAFLYGWAAFAVINTAAVAAISFVCAQYADYFFTPSKIFIFYRDIISFDNSIYRGPASIRKFWGKDARDILCIIFYLAQLPERESWQFVPAYFYDY